MRKKLIISNYDDIKNPYYAGGGARSIHEVAKRMLNEYQITIFTGRYPKSQDEIVDGIYYKRIGLSVGSPKLCQAIYQFILPFYVANEKFDLWLENFSPPFTTSFLPLFTKKPVIGLVHMLGAEDMERKYKLPFHLVENLGLRKYKNLIVTQKGIKDKIMKVNPNAVIEIIPNGVDKKIGKRRILKRHILYLGRIEINQKGLDLLVLAFKKIKNKTKYKLVIAGSGEEKQVSHLKALIKKEGLTKDIRLLGRVEGDLKQKLLEQAVCLVVPSRFETFSMVSLESLANKIPLVTFDIEGLKWLPATVRQKAKPFDIDNFADCILEVLENENLSENLKENGEWFSQKFNWEKVTEKYIQVANIHYGKNI
jgi:glycosyltransferase involved in cell wall biosynthesis